jgi:S-DNA-T family DNA segregation ATPase FtsK/SpoIIIE
MKIKVECPVCGWRGEEGICPRCDFPLEKYREILSGSPVVYDEGLREEFGIDVQKHKKIYEERTAGGSEGGQKLFPDEETQRRWYSTVVQLAEELNMKVEEFPQKINAVKQSLNQIQNEFSSKEKSIYYKREKYFKMIGSLKNLFLAARDIYDITILERLEKEAGNLDKDIERVRDDISGIQKQEVFWIRFNDINLLIKRLISVKKKLLDVETEKNKDFIMLVGTIFITFIVILPLLSLLVKSSAPLLNAFLFVVIVMSPIIVSFAISLKKSTKEEKDAQNEISFLNKRIEKEISDLEVEAKNQFDKERDIITKEQERTTKEKERIINELRNEFSDWFKRWEDRVIALREEMGQWGGDWGKWKGWEPVSKPMAFLRLGEFVRLVNIPGIVSKYVSLPALVPFRGVPGIFIPASGGRRGDVIRCLQSLGFRILASVPPGKLRFTFIDPIGLGDNVSLLLHLKEFDESDEDSLVTSRAWTEPEHINKQLSAIKEHISVVIQERLRDQYKDIEEYNREAGEIAVPYRVLMVLDFPANFTTEAAQNLLSIAETGRRVGVFVIVHYDQSRKLPYGFEVGALSQILDIKEFNVFSKWELFYDEPPPVELRNEIIQKWGSMAKEGMKVEVPYTKFLEIAGLSQRDWWKESAGEFLEVPIGLVTARKVQRLILGKGTSNHGLIVGRTGSGKSNLMHVIITTSALKYSPEELRMYLVDLKTVEFAPYQDLPHCEAVAVDADREFALSILEGLDREMLRRMELFKNIANDITEYREKTRDTLPRILLLVDEFQVLFEQDDMISQNAARLLDRLVRQGRAFGIHVLLGSQSLAGHSLPRATIDQMAVRIALQCSEADSRLVLAEDNPAARRLSRPGQAIYNSANGLIEGNTEFQVALFDDRDREEYIQRIAKRWAQRPIVFHGNEPAYIEQCLPIKERLEGGPVKSFRLVDSWVGESVSIEPPVSISWTRRSGNHLVVITREEEEGVGVLMSVVISLCVQYPADKLRIYIADFSTPEAEWANISEELQTLFPKQVQVLGRRDLLKVITELHQKVKRYVDEGEAPREDNYLVLVGLQRMRDLRVSEDFRFQVGKETSLQPTEQLFEILKDGPEAGIHVLIWCDTMGNLNRSIDRRALREIDLRIAGVMSEQDSVQLLDSPIAGRLDKPHRMILHDEARPGQFKKFRPYIVRNLEWIRERFNR